MLATLRRDGSPRLSGIETLFARGQLWLGMMLDSRKALDLRRDPRLALHSASTTETMDAGDAKISGRGVEVTDPIAIRDYLSTFSEQAEIEPPSELHLFRVEVSEIALVRVAGDVLVVESWHEGGDVKRVERR